MAKKQFKTESKKLLDMMVNSIYTHKEIFLRELISNASDALDKLYYRSLSDNNVGQSREDYKITVSVDKDARTLTVSDNGCGMTEAELENNLGTIAKSGSFDFKKDNEKVENVDIIGQFGVGFYSAFMVADKIEVKSRPYGDAVAHLWQSSGADGYTVTECEKASHGTEIVLNIKPDTENDQYSEYLETATIRRLIKKYSDYIRYPIVTAVTHEKKKEGTEDEYETVTENEVLNSRVPLWRKAASEVTKEEYNGFYRDKFFDFEEPARVIHTRSEGTATFDALLFIPKKAPYDYYTKEFEKGLYLYSSGVMIMEKCPDLLPDYFSFVKGLVDSADLSLNISRELLQHDHQLKLIAKTVEKKIRTDLQKFLESDREGYEEFFRSFGMQLKYGLYSDYGTHKDVLQDLILFPSSFESKNVTLKEYVSRMKEDQKSIYYAAGETVEKIKHLPKVEAVESKGYEVLYLTDDVDEFALRMLGTYAEKNFMNVSDENLDLSTDEEKEVLKKANEDAKEMFGLMKEALGDSVSDVRFTNTLKNHPVALTTEGGISTEMEKVLNKMPGANGMAKAETVLEINLDHKVASRLRSLYESDKDTLKSYAKILYGAARLVDGLSVENPAELSSLICDIL